MQLLILLTILLTPVLAARKPAVKDKTTPAKSRVPPSGPYRADYVPFPRPPGLNCPPGRTDYGLTCVDHRRHRRFKLSCSIANHNSAQSQRAAAKSRTRSSRRVRQPGRTAKHGHGHILRQHFLAECPEGYTCRPHLGMRNPKKRWQPWYEDEWPRPTIDCVPLHLLASTRKNKGKANQRQQDADGQQDDDANESGNADNEDDEYDGSMPGAQRSPPADDEQPAARDWWFGFAPASDQDGDGNDDSLLDAQNIPDDSARDWWFGFAPAPDSDSDPGAGASAVHSHLGASTSATHP